MQPPRNVGLGGYPTAFASVRVGIRAAAGRLGHAEQLRGR